MNRCPFHSPNPPKPKAKGFKYGYRGTCWAGKKTLFEYIRGRPARPVSSKEFKS